MTQELQWNEAVGRLRSRVSPQNYDMWLRPIELMSWDGIHPPAARSQQLRSAVVRIELSRVSGERAARARSLRSSRGVRSGWRASHSARRAPRDAARFRAHVLGSCDRSRYALKRASPVSSSRTSQGFYQQRRRRPDGRSRRGHPEPSLHVRHLRRRAVEPARVCGVASRRVELSAEIQPGVRVRRRRTRQDPPPPRDRSSTDREPPRRTRRLHLVRAVHERVRASDPRRSHARVPSQLSRGHRRVARRRRSVLGRQREHARRVLPHVQCAAREPQADRAHRRPQATRDLGHRRPPAYALCVGPARRYRASRARGPHRDLAQEGRGRSGRLARRCRALHRVGDQVATCASWKAP